MKKEIEKKIQTTIRYDLTQNPENAYEIMQCLDLICELIDDEKYGDIVKEIFTFDLKQNAKACHFKLLSIQKAIELEEELNG
jgi:hypothetical protein